MRDFVFVPVILMFSGFALGQEAPRDEKPKDGKEIAVAYMLGEPDRLLTQLVEENSRLLAFEKGKLDGDGTVGRGHTSDGIYHFANNQDKNLWVEKQKCVVTYLENRLKGLKTEVPISDLPLYSIAVGKAGFLTYCAAIEINYGINNDASSGGWPVGGIAHAIENYEMLKRHGGEDVRAVSIYQDSLRNITARIAQIIDNNQVLIRIHNPFRTGGGGLPEGSERTLLVRMPTKGLVDDQELTLPGVFVVSGTKRYETAIGGTNTVFVLEIIDPEWLKAEVKKRMPPSTIKRIVEALAREKAEADKKAVEAKAEAERKAAATKAEAEKKEAVEKAEAAKKAAEEKAETERKAAAEEAKWHTWTDSTGQYKTKAMFGGIAGGKVKLIKKDGSTVRLPLEKLSEEDRQWIKNKSH